MMTQKRRGRPPGSKNKPKSDAPKMIQITGKRVQGDDGRKHLRGEKLTVGDDVTFETAAKMLTCGTAAPIDGMTLEEQDKARADAVAIQYRDAQKARAEWEMEQFDRQPKYIREIVNEHGTVNEN